MDQTTIDHHISVLKGKLKGLKDTDLSGDDTINASITLWQKQTPRKLLTGEDHDIFVESCPNCQRPIKVTAKEKSGLFTMDGYIGHYCPWCGQAVEREGTA